MATNSQWVMDLLYPLTGANYIRDVEPATSVCYLQLSSSVCDVVCDAGTSSLWSLESHWHTTPSSWYSSCFLLFKLWQIWSALLARHLITPVRTLGWWELKLMQWSVCILVSEKPKCHFRQVAHHAVICRNVRTFCTNLPAIGAITLRNIRVFR